jgi:hypothetical protein
MMLEGLGVSRLIVYVKIKGQAPFYFFTEKIGDCFCMDGRFMKLFDKNLNVVFVEDVTKLTQLLNAEILHFYGIVQEYSGRSLNPHVLETIMRNSCAILKNDFFV